MVQEKLNVDVIFEGELAQYLKDIAEIDNKSVEEVIVDIVREALEEDIELSKIIAERDVERAELIRAEDVDWDKIPFKEELDTRGEQKYKIAYSKEVLEKDFSALPA